MNTVDITQDLAICQNPMCCDAFVPEDDELFCPECEEHLPESDKKLITDEIEKGRDPMYILRAIMNGGKWNQ